MASTSTNKQPLLVDSPLHVSADLLRSTVQTKIDIGSGNSAKLLVNCSSNDGALIEQVYAYSRAITVQSNDDSGNLALLGYQVLLYMAPSTAILDPNSAFFLGSFVAGTLLGERTAWGLPPEILAPVPHLGSEDDTNVQPTQLRALYIPKGQCLWAAVEPLALPDDANGDPQIDTAVEAPLVYAQGGYY